MKRTRKRKQVDPNFWPVIRMSDGTLRQGPKAKVVKG